MSKKKDKSRDSEQMDVKESKKFSKKKESKSIEEQNPVVKESPDVDAAIHAAASAASVVVSEMGDTAESDMTKQLKPAIDMVEDTTSNQVKENTAATVAISLEDLPKQEPIIQPAINIMSANICTFNRSINNYLAFALDTLNTCSVKEIDKIIRARITIYENFFLGVATAPTVEASNEFIGRFLDALHKRTNVTDPSRSLVGFMRLSTLTKQQANLYQIVWKLLIDTCNPATRSEVSAKVKWGSISPYMTFHKRGDVVNQRMLMFYQRQ